MPQAHISFLPLTRPVAIRQRRFDEYTRRWKDERARRESAARLTALGVNKRNESRKQAAFRQQAAWRAKQVVTRNERIAAAKKQQAEWRYRHFQKQQMANVYRKIGDKRIIAQQNSPEQKEFNKLRDAYFEHLGIDPRSRRNYLLYSKKAFRDIELWKAQQRKKVLANAYNNPALWTKARKHQEHEKFLANKHRAYYRYNPGNNV